MSAGSRLVAVIDIGSIAIRIVVAQIDSRGDLRVLDRAERPVALGRDVFSTGSVSRESIGQCLEILRRFNENGLEFAFPTQTLYTIKAGAT